MSKILEMREKRAAAWEAAKTFLDSKRGTDGLISAEDTAVYDKMEADVVNLGKEIERLERQQAIDLELAKPTGKPIKDKPDNSVPDVKTGRASNEYKAAFWESMVNKRFADVQNVLEVGEDEAGGFLVPDEFEKTLVQSLNDENIIRPLATVITTSSGDRKIPIVGAHGKASWVEESGEIPEDDEIFDQINLGAFKLATLVKISEELLNDAAFNMETYIAKEFARRIGSAEEESFLVGNGTGKPTGLFTSAEVGVTAASQTAITLDEVLDLYHSLREPYRRNAAFILNDSTVKSIRKLKDTTGNYIWQPSIQAGNPDTILSRPVKTSTYAPAIAAGAKIIAFGDLSYFWIADRQGRSLKRLNELYAAKGQVGFLASQRLDAKLVLAEAVKVLAMKGATG